MIHVMFVDDDDRMLSSLRRMLFPLRDKITPLLANGAEEACRVAEGNQIDVVVSDMRMPGENGTELLQVVKSIAPGAIRIVLSGYSNDYDSLTSTVVAHQFLSKPCNPEVLREIIMTTCSWRDRVEDPLLRFALSEVGALPSDPEVVIELLEALASEDVTVPQIVNIVREDPALVAKILQLSNSSFFGNALDSASLTAAISHVRLDSLRDLLSMAESIRTDDETLPETAELLREVRRRCRLLARAAAEGSPPEDADAAWSIGLLAGLGSFAVAAAVPFELQTSNWHDYAAAGAYLGHMWGLPTACKDTLSSLASEGDGGELGTHYAQLISNADALI